MQIDVEDDLKAIDPMALRRAFGTFVTGVTVVTTNDEQGRPRGMTANSFTSVSLDPALLLVCIGKGASSYPVFQETSNFAVNLLHDGQTDISNLFASKAIDKFGSVGYDAVHTGAPVLTDCLTWFDCKVHNCIDAGDHIILIGRILAFGTSPVAPLGFCRGRYAQVKDPLPPGWLSANDMIVGYLIEAEGSVLLAQDGKGGWVLPSASRRLREDRLPLAGGNELALVPHDTFLYSVFDIADNDPGYLIYRAKLGQALSVCALPEQFRFFPLDQLPYGDIASREVRAMLRRYAHETERGSFGIYMDSQDGGRVAMVGDAQSWDQASKV
ncbi:TPA: flavin reductase [Pseudomonas aeruginosa]|uniref:flavin reductase n=1 Tax=Pseudomonas TaxID=286 RepID=UPI000D2286FB|nr:MULTISPECIES: flavin reductase [Pseudomonas]AVZ22856.1 flavin reductase [Pseudomonas aeruginosa]HBO3287459.1 flavin reductase [Pseudomonas aeruginosa]HCR1733541.1 flavin reductase [Pseudomonas aeruginosa]HDU9072277.1 flavin reductase [Pseudomonas aeruginosa]HDU9135470.1 flavin reductase [Pseudomonas aeruginosa]